MLNYPLTLSFKLIAFNPQVKISDASGQTVLYVKQKALALKEDVKVYADEGQQQLMYQIKANKMLDFSARYNITTPDGRQVGTVQRQGMKSLWKATYNILDADGNELGLIHEENPLLKVLDAFVSDVPFLGMLINPAYLVELRGQVAYYFKKQTAVFEGRFQLEKRGEISDEEEELVLSCIVMMMMLERQRG